MINEIIPVFFTADNAFVAYLAEALGSAIKSSDPARRYRAIILYDYLSDSSIEQLSTLETESFEITFEHIGDRLGMMPGIDSSCDAMSVYYRLLIPVMFPEYDKGIYVDGDATVGCDLSALFDQNIGASLIGAYTNPVLIDVPEFTTYMEDTADVSGFEYVDTGVLLLNLHGLRECGFERLFSRACPTLF